MNMNIIINRGAFWSVAVAGATLTALGQLSVDFSSDAPGTESSPAWIQNFNLDIPADSTSLDFTATYDTQAGGGHGVLVSNPGTQTVTYTLQLATVRLLLRGTYLSGTKVLDLGPVSGSVTIAGGETGWIDFSKTARIVPAMLSVPSVPTLGTYTLTWWVSSVPEVIFGSGGKQGDVLQANHYVSGKVAVPEPMNYALVAGLGLVAFALWRRRA